MSFKYGDRVVVITDAKYNGRTLGHHGTVKASMLTQVT